ncbi:PH domain-containing protein [Listeria valentina]|uniref:PH domain-containing protein n=1 Tax=Listeria valentina TaxID=2705293 RepID=UPI00143031EB|nr:PH domain-containing protein [Listeria valentina]
MKLTNLEKKLPEKIKRVWQFSYGFVGILLILATIASYFIFSATDVNLWFSAIVFVVALLYFIIIYGFIIPFRWARWSYQIKHDEIEIQHGIIFRKRVLIPMIRIQHIETSQGPLLRQQNLVSLSITTAAGAKEIEAVNASESDELREYILSLVKVAKEDV